MRPVSQLPLTDRERSLYDLIWKRTVATQMENARLRSTTATIAVDDAIFRANGRTVVFPGFFRAYVEGSDDPEASLEDRDAPLPPLVVGEVVDCRDLDAIGHETRPPARFTEASLVKALESEGVGRPSTYASIIETIQNRGYVFKQRKELVPTFTAFAVTGLMEEHFNDLVDLKFTANMEQQLDEIATGEMDWLTYLQRFYRGETGLEEQVKQKSESIDPRSVSGIVLEGIDAQVRIGQFGPFLQKEVEGEVLRASLPDGIPPADLTQELADQLFTQKADGPKELGIDPETGIRVLLKSGPYGPYVQLGEEGEDPSRKKPKRTSLLKGMEADNVDLTLALKLLGLPRTLGEHPESGKTVRASVGRFGPYVVHDNVYASIKAPDDVLEIGLERGLQLLAEKAARGSRSSKSVLKELGEHPDGGNMQVLSGRYGPYVKHNRTNATLPKDTKPEDVTVEMAIKLIAEKAGSKKTTTRKSTAKKSTAKKSTAKKSTAKKSTTRKTTTKKTPAKKSTVKEA